MAETKIEWATHTCNPIRVEGPGKVWKHGYHCTKVSPGCAHCYAEGLNILRGTGDPYDKRKVDFYLDLSVFDTLPKKRCMVFVQSMGDLFHEDISWNFIYKVFERMLIIDHHIYIVLTKRHDVMEKIMPGIWFHLQRNYPDKAFPLKNVIGMVTGENQDMIDLRVPALLRSPFAIRGVSIEPMLCAIDIIPYIGGWAHQCKCGWHRTELELFPQGDRWYCSDCGSYCKNYNSIDWVILGGESGPKARPMHPGWPRQVRDACNDTGVPFLFKQWGEWGPRPTPSCEMDEKHPPIPFRFDCPDPYPLGWIHRYGKKKAGRLLDGREWNEKPYVL